MNGASDDELGGRDRPFDVRNRDVEQVDSRTLGTNGKPQPVVWKAASSR